MFLPVKPDQNLVKHIPDTHTHIQCCSLLADYRNTHPAGSRPAKHACAPSTYTGGRGQGRIRKDYRLYQHACYYSSIASTLDTTVCTSELGPGADVTTQPVRKEVRTTYYIFIRSAGYVYNIIITCRNSAFY